MASAAKTLRIDRELSQNAMMLRRHLLETCDVDAELTLDLTDLGDMSVASLGVIAGFARSHRRRGWDCTLVVRDPMLYDLLSMTEAAVIMRR